MRRVYKGIIWRDYLAIAFLGKVMEPEDMRCMNYFTPIGTLTDGKRTILTYVLCKSDGEIIERCSHIQFTKSRKNVFYLESVN